MEQHGRREQPSHPSTRRRRPRRTALSYVFGVFKGIFFTLWTILLIGVCTALIGLHFFKEYIETIVTPAVEVRAAVTLTVGQIFALGIHYGAKVLITWVKSGKTHRKKQEALSHE